jgi:hypothetical protein
MDVLGTGSSANSRQATGRVRPSKWPKSEAIRKSRVDILFTER